MFNALYVFRKRSFREIVVVRLRVRQILMMVVVSFRCNILCCWRDALKLPENKKKKWSEEEEQIRHS